MKLVVGLGNPGKEYSKNRHNVGFMIVDEIALKNSLSWESSSKFDADIAISKDFILAKPQTFMNKSGEAVSKILNFYKISIENLLTIHDDVDLSFGDVKKQLGAGSAGHKGVESIIERVGTQDFWRVRIGIGRPVDDTPVEDWVLRDFGDKELDVVRSKIAEINL